MNMDKKYELVYTLLLFIIYYAHVYYKNNIHNIYIFLLYSIRILVIFSS